MKFCYFNIVVTVVFDVFYCWFRFGWKNMNLPGVSVGVILPPEYPLGLGLGSGSGTGLDGVKPTPNPTTCHPYSNALSIAFSKK